MSDANDVNAETFQNIVSSVGDAVVACDRNGKSIFYNQAAVKLLGPDVSGDLAGQRLKNFGSFLTDQVTPFPPDQTPLMRGLRGEETNEVEQFVRNQARPEGIYISTTGRPLYGSSSRINGCVVVVRDISKQKKAVEEMRRANAELNDRNLELSAVNEELESFSFSVSHELRAPLRSVIGFSEILLKKYSQVLDAEGLDYLGRVRESADKLGELIDGLLDLSRLTRGEIKKVKIDLSDIVCQIAADLQRLEPTRQVEFEIEQRVFAQGDPRLLRSVMYNLMGNAWKFSAKKPRSRIEFGSRVLPDRGMTYFVKDNGAGFSEKYSDRLFTLFYRLHSLSEFEGNGIGLATAQRVIQRHGGQVWAEGQPGEGATFYFTL